MFFLYKCQGLRLTALNNLACNYCLLFLLYLDCDVKIKSCKKEGNWTTKLLPSKLNGCTVRIFVKMYVMGLQTSFLHKEMGFGLDDALLPFSSENQKYFSKLMIWDKAEPLSKSISILIKCCLKWRRCSFVLTWCNVI